jgi:hypothetical protein
VQLAPRFNQSRRLAVAPVPASTRSGHGAQTAGHWAGLAIERLLCLVFSERWLLCLCTVVWSVMTNGCAYNGTTY